jgi:hypothetical protein
MTVGRARKATTAPFGAVEKRVGKDGKSRKTPEPKQAKPPRQAEPQQKQSADLQSQPRKPPKPSKIDADVIK